MGRLREPRIRGLRRRLRREGERSAGSGTLTEFLPESYRKQTFSRLYYKGVSPFFIIRRKDDILGDTYKIAPRCVQQPERWLTR